MKFNDQGRISEKEVGVGTHEELRWFLEKDLDNWEIGLYWENAKTQAQPILIMFFHHEKWGALGKTDIYYELKVLDKTVNDIVLKMSFNHVLIKIWKDSIANAHQLFRFLRIELMFQDNWGKVPSSGLWKLCSLEKLTI